MAAGTALRNRAPSRYAPGKTTDKSMIDMDKTEIVATVAIDILGLKDVLEGTELFPPACWQRWRIRCLRATDRQCA